MQWLYIQDTGNVVCSHGSLIPGNVHYTTEVVQFTHSSITFLELLVVTVIILGRLDSVEWNGGLDWNGMVEWTGMERWNGT